MSRKQIANPTDSNVEIMAKMDQILAILNNEESKPSIGGNIKRKNNSDLQFKKKEIKKMPCLKDCKIRRKNNGVYEIRYRKHGYNMSFSSKNLDEAKQKCLEWLSTFNDLITANKHYVIVAKKDYKPKGNLNFGTFAKNYMLNVKKPNVKAKTFETYMYAFNGYIMPLFGNKNVDEIRPVFIQQQLNKLSAEKPRTCEDVKNLLNGIFEYAVNNELINRNPMKAVFIPKHERCDKQADSRNHGDSSSGI